jgi:site-specific DNA-adenine methylase
MGSKNRLAKDIVPIIQSYIDKNNINTYIELFVGGANIIDKIHCNRKIANDYNEHVITLLKYMQYDNNLSIAPEECSFEHYCDVRNNQNNGKYSNEYVSLIGYCASYGGRYFDGGYGRDKRGGRSIYSERLKNLKEQAPNLKNIEFYCNDYKNFKYKKFKNCMIYLDPPYNNTKKYSDQSINYNEFYDFCENLSKNNIVIISEYNMPKNKFKCIWEKKVKMLQKSDRIIGEDRTEKLWIIGE